MLTSISNIRKKIHQQPHSKSQTKIGISVVSCNIFKLNCKNQAIRSRNQGNLQKGKTQNRKPLRSLSAERVRRKQLKLEKKLEKSDNEELRSDLKQNLSSLQMQYDKLRLKRSLITQRQSQKSQGRARLSDIDIPFVQSDTKIHHLHNQTHLLNKCVPKSKINLLTQKYKTNLTQINGSLTKKPSQFQQSKENTCRWLNTQNSFKQRQNSVKSASNIQAVNLSQSLCSGSLSNLQVIPIGLNISIARNSKTDMQRNGNFNRNSFLGSSFHRKKGINVLSSKKLNRPSLDCSVVSLEVVKQIQRKQSGIITQTIQVERNRQVFNSYCKI